MIGKVREMRDERETIKWVFGEMRMRGRDEREMFGSGLGLVGKMNEGYFRETNLFLPPHGLFINQIGLGLGFISFGPKFFKYFMLGTS